MPLHMKKHISLGGAGEVGCQPAGSSDLVFPGSLVVNHHFLTACQDLWSHMSFQPVFINPKISLKLLNHPVPVVSVLIISSRGCHYPDCQLHSTGTSLSHPQCHVCWPHPPPSIHPCSPHTPSGLTCVIGQDLSQRVRRQRAEALKVGCA